MNPYRRQAVRPPTIEGRFWQPPAHLSEQLAANDRSWLWTQWAVAILAAIAGIYFWYVATHNLSRIFIPGGTIAVIAFFYQRFALQHRVQSERIHRAVDAAHHAEDLAELHLQHERFQAENALRLPALLDRLRESSPAVADALEAEAAALDARKLDS